jgi:hypothetical protein
MPKFPRLATQEDPEFSCFLWRQSDNRRPRIVSPHQSGQAVVDGAAVLLLQQVGGGIEDALEHGRQRHNDAWRVDGKPARLCGWV